MNKKHTKSNLSEEQKLAKRRKYAEIKADPELYQKRREKEKEWYKRKKAKGQVVSINEKSPRDIKQQRKKWKEASRKYRQKIEEKLKEQTVPQPVLIACPETNTINKIETVKEKQDYDPLQPSEVKVKIRRIRYRELRKRNILLKEIQNLKKRNAMLRKIISRQKAKLKKQVPDENKETTKLKTVTRYIRKQKDCGTIKKLIKDFYTDDCNSTIKAGKKEFLTKNKEKRQKRYLCNPLKDLYRKFLATHDNIAVSYSYFCMQRPFWVLFPKSKDRETCACVTHCNIDLLLKCLHKECITAAKNSEDIIAALCCSRRNENCFKRDCDSCKNKTLAYREFSNDQLITFHQWRRRRESYTTKTGLQKITTISTKTATQAPPLDVIRSLEEQLPKFFEHVYNIHSQYIQMKKLKCDLKLNEAILHIDFSENYGLKFGQEVQSFHFGGSRKEVCIHTAVIYTFDFHYSTIGNTSVCTVSQCLRHDAPAVWAHIIPLLKLAIENNPFIDSLHFLSDSPTAQYRNKYVFHLMTQLGEEFPQLKNITWNYSEAGHGKGAPDGVGAVLKRTADNLVNFGYDIGTFDQFINAIERHIENVLIIKVKEQEIQDKANQMPTNLKPFSGTLAVHQVLWAKDLDKLTFRKLSCFECGPGEICIHQKHLGFLKFAQSTASVSPDDMQDYVVPLAATKKFVSRSSILANITNASASSTSRVIRLTGRDAQSVIIKSNSKND